MDLISLPTGLALLALAGATASSVAWMRGRAGAGARRGASARQKPQEAVPAQQEPARRVAPKAAVEPARERAAAQVPGVDAALPVAHPAPAAVAAAAVAAAAHADAPASATLIQLDGPAWAPTEPMAGLVVELSFAETEPAALNAGAPGFADTMVSEPDFASAGPAARR
jgi:hypothetical protein